MAKDTRLFARLDLDYADHPKIVALSDSAFRAHIEMILYARKYMTDGYIPNRVANRVGFESVSELLTNDEANPSLVKTEDGGYYLHGYEDMNETKAEIESRTRRNAENGKRGGRPKGSKKTQSVTESVPHSQTHSGTQNKAETETETETDINTSSGFADAHPEVAQALEYFNDRVKQNGFRKPSDTKANRDAARLLFTRDEYPPTVIREVMDWALSNEFWRTNIRSFSKFREKFETMQAQMRRPQQSQSRLTFDQQRVRNNNQLFQDINQQIGGDMWTQDSSPRQIGQ